MVMLYGKSYRKRASEIIEHIGKTPVPKTNREDLSPGTYSNDSREYAVESSRSFARNPWKNADQRRTVSVAHHMTARKPRPLGRGGIAAP
jgi:hypothetical protein